MTTLSFEEQSNIVSVHLTTDVLVNAWQGAVVFPETNAVAGLMTDDAKGFVWQTTPHVANGRGIEFAGGIPEGATGDIVLFRFTLRETPRIVAFSPDTAVYLNDGMGSVASTLMTTFMPSVDTHASALTQDTTPPESFTPELYRDPVSFGGRSVALFSTRDLGSGVRGYEVREFTLRGVSGWDPASSPYVVNEDVTKLEIRAIDNAGNARVEELSIMSSAHPWGVYGAILSAVILLLLVYNKVRRWRND